MMNYKIADHPWYTMPTRQRLRGLIPRCLNGAFSGALIWAVGMSIGHETPVTWGTLAEGFVFAGVVCIPTVAILWFWASRHDPARKAANP